MPPQEPVNPGQIKPESCREPETSSRLQQTNANLQAPRNGVHGYRIAGIGQSADALNVTRQHLGMVIRGDRTSKSLLAKYKALMAGERQSRLLLVRSTSVKVEHTKSARTIK